VSGPVQNRAETEQRGAAARRWRWKGARYENKQLVHRHPLGFVRRVLDDFNAGSLDAATAASHLEVSRSRLYELRAALLRERDGFATKPSGVRRVNHDPTIDFDGRNYEISPTLRKTVTLVQHHRLRFWVLELPPKDVWTPILGHFTL
jgi:hypothetical protein